MPSPATASTASDDAASASLENTQQPTTQERLAEPDALRCNLQDAQPLLMRGNYVWWRVSGREAQQERRRLHQEAIRYRTERYGYVEGFGDPEWNPQTPQDYAESTTFMGLPVRLNRRIIPALRCVEADIQRECADTPYQPRRLSGLRTRNTLATGEVSNHMFGIAIDIDPDRNTCCGCSDRWREHPLCSLQTDNIYDRMAMPSCWVTVFERYGFYWLGHDHIQDTMHFEFLGDPERILVD
ncbi:MAG: M15 family metallopeptidase [Bradymonadales bacterium]|nr:M15 family metallopeptidase [Bradymonadales bacterium]